MTIPLSLSLHGVLCLGCSHVPQQQSIQKETLQFQLYIQNKYAKSDSILIHHSTPNFGGYNFVDITLQNYELKTDITTQLVAKLT